jgi:ParB/RepB/Spo0J family partition protein
VQDLAPLVLSIRAEGVISPILLSPHPVASAWNVTPFMIVSGERRWAAARSAGLQQIPANLVARVLTPAERLMVQLDENDGALRRELALTERVDAVVRAFRISGLRREQFAQAHGKTAAWMSQHLAVAKSDETTRAAMAEGYLTGMTTALQFLRLSAEDRAEVLERARRTNLRITGRLVEAAAQRQERQGASERGGGPRPGADPAGRAGRDGAEQAPREGSEGAEQAAASGRAAAEVVPRPVGRPRATAARASAGIGSAGETAAGEPPQTRDGGRPITVALSRRQLENLIVLLGEEPGATPEEQLLQLASILH